MVLVSIETGNPKGKPLVLLHGWGADSTFLMPIARMFSDRNIIAIDFPGYGFNYDKISHIKTFDDTSASILETIPCHCDVLAWSLSSLYAIKAASMDYQDKIDSIITMCGTPRFPKDPNWPGLPSNIVVKCKRLLTPRRCSRLLKYFTHLQAVEIDKICPDSILLNHLLNHMPDVSYEALCAGIEAMSLIDEREDFKYLKIPSLHLFGAKDRLVPSATSELLLHKKSVNCKIFENSAHVPHITEPIVFERTIRHFFLNLYK